MKIKEIIVVEGKNDTNKLKQYFDCDTIETNGTHLSKSKIEMLRQLNEKRGLIVFTDPDAPGTSIRNRITQAIPNVKHAFIMKEKARTTKKVGVEHASYEDLKEALEHVLTYHEIKEETITMSDLVELGLQGSGSVSLRNDLGNALFIGKCNAKTLLKRLNMLELTKEDVKKIVEGLYE